MYLLPLLVALAMPGRVSDEALADSLLTSLDAVPGAIRCALDLELPRAHARAEEFLGATRLTVLGAGVLAPLAYKLAYNVVMENMRIEAAFIDALEFRHGPCEALARSRPDMLFIVGTDWSRGETLRTLEACRRAGAHTLAYRRCRLRGLAPPPHAARAVPRHPAVRRPLGRRQRASSTSIRGS